jgi:ATP-dependent Clp protease ATP-binding subunit ClpA
MLFDTPGPASPAGRVEEAPMFDRFSENARRAMSLARQEAQRLHHDFIGTEHMLLGVLGLKDCIGTQVLRELGVDAAEARRATEASIQKGDKPAKMGQIPFTPPAKTTLEQALAEAQSLHDHHIGTEHLVLGLILADDGVAAHVLRGFGVTIGQARAQVKQYREAHPEGRPAEIRRAPPTTTGRSMSMPPVLRAAREEASNLGHRAIGTEHLLLAISIIEGAAAAILREAGATPDALRAAVGKLRHHGDSAVTTSAWTFTPYAVAALDRTEAEADSLGSRPFGPEHLLLAVLAVRDGLGVTALTSLGIDADGLRSTVVERLRPPEP